VSQKVPGFLALLLKSFRTGQKRIEPLSCSLVGASENGSEPFSHRPTDE
jgi:hypothetical protein